MFVSEQEAVQYLLAHPHGPFPPEIREKLRDVFDTDFQERVERKNREEIESVGKPCPTRTTGRGPVGVTAPNGGVSTGTCSVPSRKLGRASR